MVERGHEVDVVTPWHGSLPSFEHAANLSVYRVRQLRTALPALIRNPEQRHQPPFPDPVTIVGLRRLIARIKPELIHAYGWMAFSVATALGRKRIPMLISARDYGYFCATRTLLRKNEPCSGPAPIKCTACAADYYGPPKGVAATAGVYMCRPALARKMTGLHSVSTYVHDVTVEHMRGSDDGLVEVTIPSFQEVPSSEGIDIEGWLARLPAEPFILFVGAFRKVKGLETLFDAYRQLDSPPPLVLMGTYERDSPTDFPPEAVVLTDVPNAAVMAAWDKAMFGVMPSLWPEPLGATVAEGMSRGRPVIGTQLGGHADMLTDSAGMLVPQGDVAALREAMAKLIGDPQLREEMGRAAAERARSFRAENVLPRFEEAYRTVIAAGTGTAG
jgi:glycosyltransferase involved in cell wall biosynthesis